MGRERNRGERQLRNSSVAMALLVIPSQVIWSYFSFGVVLAIGLVASLAAGTHWLERSLFCSSLTLRQACLS